MARQIGIMPISGAIDTIQFRDTKDGRKAGKKSNMTKAKMANNPAFDRTRKVNAEFTTAAKASLLLSDAIGSLTYKTADGRAFSRLLGRMKEVMRGDLTHPLGLRTIVDGTVEKLVNFEFNDDSNLSKKIRVPMLPGIDRMTGTFTVAFSPYSPEQLIRKPEGATHFKISAAAVELDFVLEKYVTDIQNSGLQVWDNVERAASTITCHLPAACTKPLFLFVGIQYYVMEAGNPVLLHSANALKLVAAEAL